MKTIRRGLLAVGVATLVAGVLRLRGATVEPPKGGGWRELTPSELQ